MAKKCEGGNAKYEFGEETYWCTGAGEGTLESSSFGSCVGLVLFDPQRNIGMVAHYSGSLGKEKYQQKVRDDTHEILETVCPNRTGNWNGWLFGGTSLESKSASSGSLAGLDLGTSTVEQTKNLMKTVREQLQTEKMPVTWKSEGYPSYKAVKLDLSTGTPDFKK